ncbi:hypothetical protein CPLU01_01390 [Colletotrichum plurivorum]|uniref:Uncharacterized protein n=1 Tax=Colletotrichum plurivorum TaxID=2175906 RepID=A0A8H6U4R1_9PEZI|nr:hypothetical protein CPLU01_01390 [Colletotrichum plurivorum]
MLFSTSAQKAGGDVPGSRSSEWQMRWLRHGDGSQGHAAFSGRMEERGAAMFTIKRDAGASGGRNGLAVEESSELGGGRSVFLVRLLRYGVAGEEGVGMKEERVRGLCVSSEDEGLSGTRGYK